MALWDDAQGPILAAKTPAVNSPVFGIVSDDGAGSEGVGSYFFGASSMEMLFNNVQFTHRISPHSSIRPHIHWLPSTTGLGGITFGIEYVVLNYHQPVPVTKTVYCRTETTGEIFQFIDGFGEIGADAEDDIQESSIILGRFFRDPTDSHDTYADDVIPVYVDYHIQIEKEGTQRDIPKWE